MKKTSYLLAALMFGLVVVGARGDDAKTTETSWDPLKVGNAWTYKVGAISLTVRVAKEEEFNGQLCVRVETLKDGTVAGTEDIAVKDDGVYRYAYNDKKAEPPVLFLKLPAAKDQTWNIDTTIDGQKVTGTFTSGMVAEVSVPAGVFKDVYTSTGEMVTNGAKFSLTYFFAKDVGMIKQVISAQGKDITLELEKFEPAK